MRWLSIDGELIPIKGGGTNAAITQSIKATDSPVESIPTASSIMTSMITEGLNDI